MAHLVDTMAYAAAGGTPWHGLGNALASGLTIEQWIEAAGLTWTVELAEVAAKQIGADGVPHWQPAKEYRITYRSDTGKRFAVVSPEYTPLQPKQVLEFFRSLADSHNMHLETAGALKEGAVVWALATNARTLTIKGDDKVKPYLLASTSYDTSQSRRWAFTTVRVVCNNTLRLSYSKDNEGVVSVRNNSAIDDNDVKIRLGLLDKHTATFEEAANRLAEYKPTRDQVDTLLVNLFGKPDDKGQPMTRANLTTQSRNTIEAVERCIVASPGSNLDSSRGTAWGVLNGVTRYVDYEARARSTDNRLNSAWFGRGDALKGAAMSALLSQACDNTAADTGLLADVLNATAA